MLVRISSGASLVCAHWRSCLWAQPGEAGGGLHPQGASPTPGLLEDFGLSSRDDAPCPPPGCGGRYAGGCGGGGCGGRGRPDPEGCDSELFLLLRLAPRLLITYPWVAYSLRPGQIWNTADNVISVLIVNAYELHKASVLPGVMRPRGLKLLG